MSTWQFTVLAVLCVGPIVCTAWIAVRLNAVNRRLSTRLRNLEEALSSALQARRSEEAPVARVPETLRPSPRPSFLTVRDLQRRSGPSASAWLAEKGMRPPYAVRAGSAQAPAAPDSPVPPAVATGSDVPSTESAMLSPETSDATVLPDTPPSSPLDTPVAPAVLDALMLRESPGPLVIIAKPPVAGDPVAAPDITLEPRAHGDSHPEESPAREDAAVHRDDLAVEAAPGVPSTSPLEPPPAAEPAAAARTRSSAEEQALLILNSQRRRRRARQGY